MLLQQARAGFFLLILLVLVAAETKSFWHITDVHINLNYNPYGSAETNCQEFSNSSVVSFSGKPGCDTPTLLFQSALDFMNTKESAFLIFTGDSSQQVLKQISPSSSLSSTQLVTNLLLANYNSSIFPCIGNLDVFPVNTPPIAPEGEPKQWYRNLLDIWMPFFNTMTNSSEAKQTFLIGGYYTTLIEPGFRLIVLNTNYYFSNNGTSPFQNMPDPVSQFAWLKSTLSTALQFNQQVLIIGHIPPGVYARSAYNATEKRWYFDSFNEQYISIIRQYCSIIVGQLYGHEHEDGFKLFYKSNFTLANETCSFLLDNPSISPKNYTEGISPTNPAIRLFTYQTNSNSNKGSSSNNNSNNSTEKVLMLYEQFFFNLKDFNASLSNVTAQDWKLEYNTLEHWNISALTPLQLHLYFERLNLSSTVSSDLNDDLTRYLVRASVSFDTEPLKGCQIKTLCKLRQMCAIAAISYYDYKACTDVITPFFVVWWVIVLIFLAPPVILALVFVFSACMSICFFKDRRVVSQSEPDMDVIGATSPLIQKNGNNNNPLPSDPSV